MQLIKITKNEKGEQLVSARELHESLGLDKSNIAKWLNKNIVNDDFFIENKEYSTFVLKTKAGNVYDYILKLDMAKHLCMMARTEKAKDIRNYFIECEKKLKEISIPSYQIENPVDRAKAWIVEQEEKQELECKTKEQGLIIAEYEPKVEYFDSILKTHGLMTITQIAKDYGLTGQGLNKILHEEKIQYKQSGQWLLYVDHAVKGYTKSETVPYIDSKGVEKTKLNTKWKQKGRLMIHGLLEKRGIKANMDEENV